MGNLNKELAYEAKKNGICNDWFNLLLKAESKDRLMTMYLKGIDFCLSNEYPPLSFFREHGKGIMEKYGVFLDEPIAVGNSHYVVALGTCEGEAQYTGFAVGQVFVKHDSKLTIAASENSFVMVDMFDNTEVLVKASGNAKVCVNRYGGTVQTETESGPGHAVIKIIEKNSKTY